MTPADETETGGPGVAGSAATKSGEGRGDDRGPEGGNRGSRKAMGLEKGGGWR